MAMTVQRIRRGEALAALAENEATTARLLPVLVDAAWTVLEETSNLLAACGAAVVKAKRPDNAFTAALLLDNALADTLAGLRLALAGQFRPAGATLRAAVETAALGVALVADGTVYERFKHGEFSVPKAVSIAKKEVTGFGGLYGMFTTAFTHEQFESSARGFRVREGVVEKSFVPRIYPDGLLPIAGVLVGVSSSATLAQYGGVWLYRREGLEASGVDLECDSERSSDAFQGAIAELARMHRAAEAGQSE